MKLAVLLPFIFLFQVKWVTYSDDQSVFTMKYPDTWSVKKMGNSAVAFVTPPEGPADQFQENVNLMLQDLSQRPDVGLEEFTEITRQQIKNMMGADVPFSSVNITFQGRPAKKYAYNLKYDKYFLKITQYCFIKDKTVYLFTYAAEPAAVQKYEAIAMQIINSFKLEK